MEQKYLEAAQAEYDALLNNADYASCAMIHYLAELYVTLNELDPENHSIDDHWSFAEGEE